MDGPLIALIEDAARPLGIATRRMPTVGHDAAMFARAGIPCAVLLIRNANGSHNSDEALDREDFAAGVHVLARAMHRLRSATKRTARTRWRIEFLPARCAGRCPA